jgi:predicted RNA binding protein YcfA (HicA-like mRNA interferase family)
LPRLPVLNGREVRRALERAGFVFDRQDGGHAILFHPETNVTVSVPMHGGRDMPTGTLRGIIADAGLTVAEFQALLR